MTHSHQPFQGLPAWTFDLVHCPADDGRLAPDSKAEYIRHGTATCGTCGAQWPIVDGVLDLLEPTALDVESRREMERRDVHWSAVRAECPPLTDMDRAELDSHLAALTLAPTHTVLEFGCGAGRFSYELSRRAGRVVAVDFSLTGLHGVASLVGANVALVRADVTKLQPAAGAFDRALSTLTSNLPTPETRDGLFRVAATGLHAGGRFVFGVHYYGTRARLIGVHKEGYYDEDGIYRLYMTKADCREMAGPHFGKVALRPVAVMLPLSRTLRLPLYATSRVCERIPGLADFGELLMGVADQPRRQSARTAAAA
jgi:SAM-dependent methyltransferase